MRRFAGEKGRVLADAVQLDRWRQANLEGRRWWSSPVFFRLYAAVASALLLIAAGSWVLSTRKGPPARFHHEFKSLVVSDERGRELWRKTFQHPFHRDATPENLVESERAWFGDVDGDGRVELLYTYHPATVEKAGDTLFCLSDKGREKWRFIPGKAVFTRVTVFPLPCGIGQFTLLPPGRDGARRVVVVAHHISRYPSQVVVLSRQGAVLGEYWHSGHFLQIDLTDLDGDGSPEILLAGVSNGHRAATLVVLDPGELGGASVEENLDFQLQGFAPGREKARILFPRTCINRKFEQYGRPSVLAVQGDSIRVAVTEKGMPIPDQGLSVLYRLNRELEVTDVLVNAQLSALHRELEAAGQLDHSFTEGEQAELRNLRYLKRLAP